MVLNRPALSGAAPIQHPSTHTAVLAEGYAASTNAAPTISTGKDRRKKKIQNTLD